MKPADSTKAAAAGAFLVIAGLVAIGVLRPDVSPGKRRVTVSWLDGGVPAGNIRCLWTSALASQAALTLFGLDTDGGSSQYVHVRQCAVVPEGVGMVPGLPPGFDTLDETQTEVAYDGGPQLLAVMQDEPEAPCACSTGLGTGCEMLQEDGGWSEARYRGRDGGWMPWNNTLQPSQWRGSCRRKVCVEFGGASSWPAECVPQ